MVQHAVWPALFVRAMVRIFITIAAVLLFWGGGLLGQSRTETVSDKDQPPIRELSNNVYQIGKLVVDGNKQEISLDGWVNMTEGMIELLACAPGGKIHESVLVLDVEPFHLQVALLLLGLQFGGNLGYQGDPETPCGDSVEIYVEWTDPTSGELKSVRGEDLVYDIPAGRPMEHTQWVFSGSRIVNGVFLAQADRSLVTTYHDPNTIIDNPLPEGGDDTVYEVNRLLVPPEGTKVEVTIRPYRMREKGSGSG